MQAFIVEAENKPGEFARHTQMLADRGINLYAVCLAIGNRGGAAFLVSDETAARSVLTDGGIGFREVPAIALELEDRPGTAAAASRRLADAGVNIELFAPFMSRDGKKATVVVGVDKLDVARKAVADLTTDWTPAEAWKSAAKVSA